MTEVRETCEAPAFRFVRIDGQGSVVTTAGMRRVVRAPAEGTAVPAVHNVKRERRLDSDGGMQTFRGVPGTEADARDKFAAGPGGMKGHGFAIAKHRVARIGKAFDLDLQPVERRIDITHRAGRPRLTEHRPGFECLPELKIDPVLGHIPIPGKTEFKVRRKPVARERVTVVLQVPEDVPKVFLDKMGQQKPVVQGGAPANQLLKNER
jgi:hypothetical protein